MPIYTRTGDQGNTAVFGGRRISKSHPRIEACGSLDELSSIIGLITSGALEKLDRSLLTSIQRDLYQISAGLSGAKITLVTLEKKVKFFEQKIDKMTSLLPKLTGFILPQGSRLSSWFHFARTVCRRCERRVTAYFKNSKTSHPSDRLVIVSYLNRLSDLFFTLARKYNRQKEILI